MEFNDIHQGQLARFHAFFRAKLERSLTDRQAEKGDFESDRLVDDSAIYNVGDVRVLLQGYHEQIMAHFKEELEDTLRISSNYVTQVFYQAQASGMVLQVGDISALESGAGFGQSPAMGAPPLLPKAHVKLEAVDGAGVTDPALVQEIQDLKEELRQVKDRNIKMQTDMSNVARDRSALAAELDQVKVNLKEHIMQKHASGGGGNEMALNSMLQQKETECEQLKQSLGQKLSQSQQFKQLKQLVQKKTQDVKDLKQYMAAAGLAVPGTGDDGLELEADSD